MPIFLILIPLAVAQTGGREYSGKTPMLPMSPAGIRHLHEMAAKVQPLEDRARQALDRRDYQTALDNFHAAARMRRALKFGEMETYAWQRPECYFGLGQYDKVIESLGPTMLNSELGPTKGIALIHLGRFQEARKLWSPHMCTWYTSTFDYSKYLPGASSPQRLEASFRLTRGLNRFYRGQSDQAKFELEQSLRLVPHDPFISAYLRRICLQKQTPVPASLASDAANLPGPLGR
jgi:tetratricopeptide (TPR) repeat protein